MNKKIILPAMYLLLTLAVFVTTAISQVSNNRKNLTADTISLYTDKGNFIELNNGIVSAKITKSNAHITSYQYKGFEVLSDGYYSMDGGQRYAQPSHCEVSVKKQTASLVDIAFTSAWQAGARQQAFDIEVHYVIEKAVPGIYCYALLSHQATYPPTQVVEWRYVWKTPQDLFDHILVDSLRNMDMPTSADMALARRTTIPESVKLTTGVKAGTYECKYGYSVAYYDVGTFGLASNKNKIGAWMVLGGYDFFNDGPMHQDLNAADNAILVHLGRNHYAGSTTAVDTSEQWSKIYGPFLLYLNSDKAGANALWADAKKKVMEEKSKWPYQWLDQISEYPATSERGSATGTFIVKDPFKSTQTGGNAWVGLTAPGVDWEQDSKHYQYWIKADSKGRFTIPAIRPGSYTLHAYVTGVTGEFSKANITIKKSVVADLGNLVWEIPRNKGKLVWEIGIPDRTAREYKFGIQYWNSFMWETYSPAMPNPLVYTVGKSNWRNDWNYVQSAYWNQDGSFSPWPWKINFKLGKLADTGVATLTFCFAAVDRGRLQTFINDSTKPFDVFIPTFHTGGNVLVRQGIHANYSSYVLKIPVSQLHEGDNYILLLANSGINRTDHIMYDYISLEVPE